MFIAVTGPSGVGKTTISEMLCLILDHEKTIILHGDDLHRWERDDNNWNKFTHLNPKANNLEKGFEQLKKLKSGKAIYRSLYNHDTGRFDDQLLIEPNRNVISEGLHSIYDEKTRSLFDYSIYVETDKILKKTWKIKRDTKKRGYTVAQSLEAIKNREADEALYIKPQKDTSDAIVYFSDNNGIIDLKFVCNDEKLEKILNELTVLHKKQQSFRGGNISFKHDDIIFITPSGFDFSQINLISDYTKYNMKKSSKPFQKDLKPSMELPVHIKLKKNVIHTHPLNLLTILCCQSSEEILRKLFCNYDYDLIDYATPGRMLSELVDNKKEIIFAKNHGLFVTSDDSLEKCYELTCKIESICCKFLEDTLSKNFLFPDAFVLEEETRSLHLSIFGKLKMCNLNPSYLSKNNLKDLESMEDEKYRKEQK